MCQYKARRSQNLVPSDDCHFTAVKPIEVRNSLCLFLSLQEEDFRAESQVHKSRSMSPFPTGSWNIGGRIFAAYPWPRILVDPKAPSSLPIWGKITVTEPMDYLSNTGPLVCVCVHGGMFGSVIVLTLILQLSGRKKARKLVPL